MSSVVQMRYVHHLNSGSVQRRQIGGHLLTYQSISQSIGVKPTFGVVVEVEFDTAYAVLVELLLQRQMLIIPFDRGIEAIWNPFIRDDRSSQGK